MDGTEIILASSVNLLGIEIRNVSNLCVKARTRVNEICGLQSYLNQKGMATIINSFVYSNFNYGSLLPHLSTKKSKHKIEKNQERKLNDYAL